MMIRNVYAGLLLGAMIFSGLSNAAQAAVYQGYTFYASGATAYLLDPSGTSVHTWKASGSAQTGAYLLADGSALFPIRNSCSNSTRHNGAYPNGRFQKISWDGEIAWDYTFCNGTDIPGYDVEPMPNGNILFGTDGNDVSKVIEVKPTGSTTGEVVWEYQLPSDLSSGNTYINSVSYNPELDQILIDLQEAQRKLVVIDHSGSGSVVYTYTVGSSGRVHAAIWASKYFMGTDQVMPDADATAMRHNNLLVVYNGGSRAVEVNMSTNSVVKTFSYSFSDHEGSVQRLPNGNTLLFKQGGTSVVEVDDNGTTVGSVKLTTSGGGMGGGAARAYMYGPSYPGLSRLGLSAAAPRTAVGRGSIAFRYNPSANLARIALTGVTGAPVLIRIFSTDGRLVSRLSSYGSEAVFSTGKLNPGMYLIEVTSLTESVKASFLKLK
jgi:hypothetical protein